MKKYFFLLLICLACPLGAAQLPDNMYFRAMSDEMRRTQKELRVKGSPRPYFTVYKVTAVTSQTFSAQFGAPYAVSEEPETWLQAAVYMYAGNAKENSSGFVNNMYYFEPAMVSSVPVSYEGLRRVLWQMTDMEYVAAGDSYEKKMAYKRQKNITDDLPDFSKAPKASYVRDITPFVKADGRLYQQLVNELSALGKKWPYLENFGASLRRTQQDIYFLDSEGDFYQYSRPACSLRLSSSLRNKDGYKESLTENIPLECFQTPDAAELRAKTEEFLARLQDMYNAKKAEPYLGPVLLEPKAAGGFFNQLFVRNANNSKPLLSAQAETDGTAGQFKDKLGMRVISHLLDVYDRPQLREYDGRTLPAFMPLDDEGVESQELQLVQSGKLLALPTIRSLVKGQKQSNGHARMSSRTLPRAALTNVFFTPKTSLTQEELEQKLLDRCRELGLEYGYIFPRFAQLKDGKGEINFAWRIYTADGHKEPVYGLRLEGVTTRSLRDVLAAGSDEEVSVFADNATLLSFAVITPSVLVDEIEILPTQRKPDRAPFVALP